MYQTAPSSVALLVVANFKVGAVAGTMLTPSPFATKYQRALTPALDDSTCVSCADSPAKLAYLPERKF